MDQPTKVKICGITRRGDALLAARWGADFLGLIFSESPRRVTLEEAGAILLGFPYPAAWVGVFVNEPLEAVRSVVRRLRLTWVQLHGCEDGDYAAALTQEACVIKAFEVKGKSDLRAVERYPLPWVLLEGPKGPGPGWDPALAAGVVARKKVFLAGGLKAETVGEAVRRLRPYAVDVARGVEASPGRKDPRKMKAFIRAVKNPPKDRGGERNEKRYMKREKDGRRLLFHPVRMRED